jgi:hypothetical protein
MEQGRSLILTVMPSFSAQRGYGEMVGTSGGRNTRWTVSLMLYASVVLISGLGGLLQQATGAPPIVGGAGYAAYFDHQRADILAMRWVDPPRDGEIKQAAVTCRLPLSCIFLLPAVYPLQQFVMRRRRRRSVHLAATNKLPVLMINQ